MIKEVIEGLPGGRMFILAQRSRGTVAGIVFGMFLSCILSIITLTNFTNFKEENSYILHNIIVQVISILIMTLIGSVTYYHQINDANKDYRGKVENK
jgi:uncharacterized membrane protein